MGMVRVRLCVCGLPSLKIKKPSPNLFKNSRSITQGGVQLDVLCLTKTFPQSKLLICLFHTLQSMKREVSTEKLGISQGERSMCLEILLKMDELKNTPQRVVEYFESNWHSICHEWVDGLKNATWNFMNHTNNRVESINQS